MIVLYGGVIVNRSNYGKSNKSKTNKGDIINIVKAVVKRYILMQITARAKAENTSH
jgi:hypothetical protein